MPRCLVAWAKETKVIGPLLSCGAPSLVVPPPVCAKETKVIGLLLSCGRENKNESEPGQLLGVFPGVVPEKGSGSFPGELPGKRPGKCGQFSWGGEGPVA